MSWLKQYIRGTQGQHYTGGSGLDWLAHQDGLNQRTETTGDISDSAAGFIIAAGTVGICWYSNNQLASSVGAITSALISVPFSLKIAPQMEEDVVGHTMLVASFSALASSIFGDVALPGIVGGGITTYACFKVNDFLLKHTKSNAFSSIVGLTTGLTGVTGTGWVIYKAEEYLSQKPGWGARPVTTLIADKIAAAWEPIQPHAASAVRFVWNGVTDTAGVALSHSMETLLLAGILYGTAKAFSPIKKLFKKSRKAGVATSLALAGFSLTSSYRVVTVEPASEVRQADKWVSTQLKSFTQNLGL